MLFPSSETVKLLPFVSDSVFPSGITAVAVPSSFMSKGMSPSSATSMLLSSFLSLPLMVAAPLSIERLTFEAESSIVTSESAFNDIYASSPPSTGYISYVNAALSPAMVIGDSTAASCSVLILGRVMFPSTVMAALGLDVSVPITAKEEFASILSLPSLGSLSDAFSATVTSDSSSFTSNGMLEPSKDPKSALSSPITDAFASFTVRLTFPLSALLRLSIACPDSRAIRGAVPPISSYNPFGVLYVTVAPGSKIISQAFLVI